MGFDFYRYMDDLESKVISEGARKGMLGKAEKVSIRNGRLASRRFGRIMRVKALSLPLAMAIDYYGLMKKSDGFWAMVSALRDQFKGQQLKSVEALVVHFAALRIETVAELAPHLVADFPTFKKQVLMARGFTKEVIQ
jgi:hypothetical protein